MADPKNAISESRSPAQISLARIFMTFLKAGLISFGGGAVAYQREYVVTTNRWFDDDAFLDVVEISQALPGLNSVNLSVIVGDKLAGIPGAIDAVFGFVLPGAIVVMIVGAAWGAQQHNPNVRFFLIGVAAASVGLLSSLTWRLGRKQFAIPLDLMIILTAFIAVSFLHIPLYLVLLVIGPCAVWLHYSVTATAAIDERAQHLRERLRHRHFMYIRH
jgi:chromate transporter